MKNIDKILDLIKKTGDRFIVEDAQGRQYAIMDIKEYEKIVTGGQQVQGLSKEELVDKINRDINVWKSDNEAGEDDFNFPDEAINEAEFSQNLPEGEVDLELPQEGKEAENKEADRYYFEPEEEAF